MGGKEIQLQIDEIEKELTSVKYNKKTQFAIGLMKAKIAKLKGKAETSASKKAFSYGFSIKKSGHATVVLVGFPSVGKSTVLNKITNAKSTVAAYEFTTLKPVPGIMKYNDANIQIIDVPGIIYGAASGKGRGKEVISIMRNSDLLLILLDIYHIEHYDALINEINEANIRTNKKKPKVIITKREKGGLTINPVVPLKCDVGVLKTIAKELRLINADITIYDPIDEDEFIDVIEGNREYIPSLIVINKYDQYKFLDDVQKKELMDFVSKNHPVIISATDNYNIDELKKEIFEKLELIRIFTKDKIKGVDMKEPIILRKGSTLKEVGLNLHKEFVVKFKFCKIWGKSTKFDGQVFRDLSHKVEDRDIIEFFLN